MRTITTRLRRLEKRMTPEVDFKFYDLAVALYERRRQRYLKCGKAFRFTAPNTSCRAAANDC